MPRRVKTGRPEHALEQEKDTIGLIKLLFYAISGILSNIKDLFLNRGLCYVMRK